METENRVKVTLYDVIFKGIYGRNRKPKFDVAHKVEVEPSFVPTPEFFATLLDTAAANISPKTGTMIVRRTEGCERTDYDIDGRKYSTFAFPLFAATRLAVRNYTDKVGVDVPAAAV